jgi:hypothetical protein
MTDAELQYQTLTQMFVENNQVVAGQMFGKACLKVNGKAFVAQHKDTVVFKLPQPIHLTAMSEPEAILWDPSGKGRPMKEWVALPTASSKKFKKLALAALEYVNEAKP